MTTLPRNPWHFFPFVVSMLLSANAFAQAPAAEDKAAPPVKAEAPTDETTVAGPLIERNPAVRTALELPRKEPADYLQSILWLIDLGRPELARPILDQLKAMQLTDAQRAAFVGKFGSHRMLKLARTTELAPAGTEFAEACMAAAAAGASDPKHLATLVNQLADPSAEVRHAARVDLMAAGQAGVNATLEALARETDPQRRSAFTSAAARMEPLVVGPLLAMLDTSDTSLKTDSAQLLASLQVSQAAPFLTGSDLAEREQSLVRAIDRYRQGTPIFAPNELGQVELWHWNDAAKQLSATRVPADEAQVIWTARLARELARLRPDNRDYQRQALVLSLEAAGLTAGASAKTTSTDPNEFSADAFDTPLLNNALVDALAHPLPHAAIAITGELGKRRDTSILYTADGHPSPLANALTNSNRRIRFAALRAILAIDPASPYPGSSRLPEMLVWFAASSGTRRALVAMPTAVRATDLASARVAAGLEAEAANQGTEAVQLARRMADLEMILVDMDIQSPGIRQVVYELRIHPTTGGIPIALLAAEGRFTNAQRLAAEHERVIAVSRPHSAETVKRIVEQLAAAGRDFVPAEERAAQAVQAVTWLAELLGRDREFYSLHSHAPVIEASLHHTKAIEQAMAAFEKLGTPASQVALVDFASQNPFPIESRRVAATAFHGSVQVHGVLLTTDEIQRQYDRYNASATADADTHQVLGSLLDSIESRRDAGPPAVRHP